MIARIEATRVSIGSSLVITRMTTSTLHLITILLIDVQSLLEVFNGLSVQTLVELEDSTVQEEVF